MICPTQRIQIVFLIATLVDAPYKLKYKREIINFHHKGSTQFWAFLGPELRRTTLTGSYVKKFHLIEPPNTPP